MTALVQQRTLVPRPTPRAATNPDHLAALACRLTDRDRWLARMLHEHKVLTTHQITQLAWPSTRAANLRLLELFRWRVLDRFQPFTPTGSAPMHYVLDTAGAAILAAEDGLDAGQFAYNRRSTLAIAHSLQLAHTLGTNTIFTTLVARARHTSTTGRLTAWWSEDRCRRHFGDLARPDAYGRWSEPTAQVEWFLEYDRGTEPLRRLAAKLHGYARLATTTNITTPVLFWLPTARREAPARRALSAAHALLPDPSHVPIATTSTDQQDPAHVHDAYAPRWLPLCAAPTTGRLRLIDLPRAWPALPPLPRLPSAAPVSGEPPPPDPLPPGPSHRGR